MFKRKKPKRLYYPVKSSWYTKPRRRRRTSRSKGWFPRKKIRHFFSISPIYWLGIITIGILGFLLFFSSYFRLSDIEVARKNFSTDVTKIEVALKPYIGKNIFSLSKSEIRQFIQKDFPEFSDIKISKRFPSKLFIDLNSHSLVANLKLYYTLPEVEEIKDEDFAELNRAIEDLSNSDPDLANSLPTDTLKAKEAEGAFNLEETLEEAKKPEIHEQKGILNQVGQVIFDQEENLELFTVYIKGLTQPVQDREEVVEATHMKYMTDSMKYFENQMDLSVESVNYLPIARELHLNTSDNRSFWLTLERSYEDQINKLKTIYDPAELSKEPLSYIDLRIREKVIYCPKGAACDQP